MARSPRKQRLHDPTVLRAIAHPMRNRILNEMSATGPTRAADIAHDLGIPANQASFHLRQLAKYGLVEEAVGAGRDKRDRVWKLVDEDGLSLNMEDLENSPGGKAAVTVFRRNASAWAHEIVDAAYSPDHQKDTLQTVTEQSIRLTKAEAERAGRRARPDPAEVGEEDPWSRRLAAYLPAVLDPPALPRHP